MNIPFFRPRAPAQLDVKQLLRKAIAANRLTSPRDVPYNGPFDFLPRKYEHLARLNLQSIRTKYTANELLEILASTEPDISMGIWTMLRVADQPMKVYAKTLDRQDDPEGQRIVNEILLRLDQPEERAGYQHSRSLSKIKTQLHLSGFVWGAACLEVVPTEDLDDIRDLAPFNPCTLVFTRENGRLIPWQKLDNPEVPMGYRKLDYPNILYEELDAFPDDPYGRSPILSTLQILFFKIQVLADLKAIVHKQGYPRIDLKVVEKVIIDNAPPQIKADPKKRVEFVNKQIQEILDHLASLDPDQPLVHVDSIEATMLGGNTGPVIDVQKLMNVIDSQIVSACKTLSVFLGRHFGKTETYASIEVQIYNRTVEAIKELSRRLFGRALTLGLRLRGHQGIVEVKYDVIDWKSPQEREQAKTMAIDNAIKMRDQGWITDEEACEMVTGHKPTGTPRTEEVADDVAGGN